MPASSPRSLLPRARWFVAAVAGLLLVHGAGKRAQVPLDAERLLQRGEQQLQTGDAPAALRTFAQVTRFAPGDARGFDGVARALQAGIGFPRREAAAESLLAAQESVLVCAQREHWPLASRATALRNHGFACFRLGEFARALSSLQQLHASGAGSLETDLALAVTARACQLPEDAERLTRMARIRYGDLEPVWKLAMASQLECGPWATAEFVGLRNLKPLRQAGAAADPCSVPLAAEVDLDGGRIAAAEAGWRTMLGGPASTLAHLGLGRAALRRAAPAEALQHFDAALADTSVPRETAHYWRAQALGRLGRFAEARAELQRAAAANPLAARDGVLLGILATTASDTAAAIAAYQRVLDLDRRHPEALYRLGILWLGTSQRDEGRALLQRYLEVQPDGAYASDVRLQLRGG
jgi:tetratricopeptide (TPR) repeat protein